MSSVKSATGQGGSGDTIQRHDTILREENPGVGLHDGPSGFITGVATIIHHVPCSLAGPAHESYREKPYYTL